MYVPNGRPLTKQTAEPRLRLVGDRSERSRPQQPGAGHTRAHSTGHLTSSGWELTIASTSSADSGLAK